MAEEQTVPANETAEAAPVADHGVIDSGVNEEALFADVMKNSPIMETLSPSEAEVPHPEESTEEQAQEEPAEDLEPVEEAAVDTNEEEVEPINEETESGDVATTEAEVFEVDELDDFSVNVKIDGKTEAVNIKDLVKGYATDQHLSRQGRELGEMKKQIEAERDEKLKNLEVLNASLQQEMIGPEKALADEYKELNDKIEKAEKEGDEYEINNLTAKQSRIQKKYWDARNKREALANKVIEAKKASEEELFQKQIEHFHNTITDHIPDYNEDIAKANAEFALSRGISQDVLNVIVDPSIVKFIDDFRRAEEKKETGAVKRKAVPVRRAVPQKKARTEAQRTNDAQLGLRSKVLSGNGNANDEMNFLRGFASKHF